MTEADLLEVVTGPLQGSHVPPEADKASYLRRRWPWKEEEV
jgi:hypothetical protein